MMDQIIVEGVSSAKAHLKMGWTIVEVWVERRSIPEGWYGRRYENDVSVFLMEQKIDGRRKKP